MLSSKISTVWLVFPKDSKVSRQTYSPGNLFRRLSKSFSELEQKTQKLCSQAAFCVPGERLRGKKLRKELSNLFFGSDSRKKFSAGLTTALSGRTFAKKFRVPLISLLGFLGNVFGWYCGKSKPRVQMIILKDFLEKSQNYKVFSDFEPKLLEYWQ